MNKQFTQNAQNLTTTAFALFLSIKSKILLQEMRFCNILLVVNKREGDLLEKTENRGFLSSFTLRSFAMIFMLCDHLWATIIPGNQWLTCVGRIAFPIFAFLIAEGYFNTKNFKKYLYRMLFFAVITEVPFNLMCVSMLVYPFHQNVLWTFVWALLCMKILDKIREKPQNWKNVLLFIATVFGFVLLGMLTMCDYGGNGVLTVLVFYFFRGKAWYLKALQLAALAIINFEFIKGMVIPFEFLGLSIEFPQQGFAVLALAFIWLYSGKQGPYNKFIKYFNYAFYPGHMLLLWFLSTVI